MQNFLDQVTQEIWDKYGSFDNITIIVPSKRAGTFIRSGIPKITGETVFAPKILSIESFVELISGLTNASQTTLLFELYEAYLKENPKDKEGFASFSRWSVTVLQDFNEIDRYLVPPEDFFSSLSFIKEIEQWSLEAASVTLVEDYIVFWKKLNKLYNTFNTQLVSKGYGHQGLLYRNAIANLETYIAKEQNTKFVFIGFSALNKAEELLIQCFLDQGNSEIYWDIDKRFLEDPIHDAGFFIRRHFEKWSYFKERNPKGLSNHFNTNKNIQIIGVPKNIAQTKYIGSIVDQISSSNPEAFRHMAIVLGDESLLNPLLNSLPQTPGLVNITMGYPLKKTSLSGLFLSLFELYIQPISKGWYYKNILALLSNPAIQEVLTFNSVNKALELQTRIKESNWTYVSSNDILDNTDFSVELLKDIFSEKNTRPERFIETILNLIDQLRLKYKLREAKIDLVNLSKYRQIFKELEGLLSTYPYINDLKALLGLFKELLRNETVDFIGEPLEGLQVMGMLESRNLDFETVLITSVNEGFLPSGKTNNSFIPFDLKRRFGLPTYKEKDAVYTYHFYRLLQRAKNVYLVYNTEPDVIKGGEKSRFISQLIMDEFHHNNVTHDLISPEIELTKKKQLVVRKDSEVLIQIEDILSKGLSPSSLSSYIDNPIEFYKRKILGLKESITIEETIAHNTFGTVIHIVLEKLYTPFIGTYLNADSLKLKLKELNKLVVQELQMVFKEEDIRRGKNLIASQIIVKYLERFIKAEIEDLKSNEIKIIALEEELSHTIPIKGLNHPIRIKGIIDRVDERNGIRRILDYKTGQVNTSEVEITSWEEVRTSKDRAKAFQLLCYAYLYMKNHSYVNLIYAGIIPIKLNRKDPILFCTKPGPRSTKKNYPIEEDTLANFSEELTLLIKEIANPDIPFQDLKD